MKRSTTRTTVLALLIAAGSALAQAPATGDFTYQGKLTFSAGSPVIAGQYDVIFKLYDAASGGTLLATAPPMVVDVNSGGLFTANISDPTILANLTWEARWLGVSVRPHGVGTYTDLAPLQKITAAPLAKYALGPWQTSAGGYSLSSGGGSYLSFDHNGDLHGNGGTDGVFGLFSEGASTGSFNILTNNITRLAIKNDTGNVGIGTTSPATKFHLFDSVSVSHRIETSGGTNAWARAEFKTLNGQWDVGTAQNFNGDALYFYREGAPSIALSVNPGGGIQALSTFGIGVTGNSTSAGTFGQLGTPSEGILANGGPSHRGLTAVGAIEDAIVAQSNGVNKSGLVGFSTNAAGYGAYLKNFANGTALWCDGLAKVNTLQITGGSDLAEPFDVNPAATQANDEAEPGMVVIIDAAHPGQLRLADSPYDTKVAGVISGANGLAPGMVMRAEGQDLADGKHPVAMTGRVWVWCDASSSPIQPGDRLTTSTTPGHAMAAADSARAPGTVFGKAMTGLTEGKGLVLVLVNLQ